MRFTDLEWQARQRLLEGLKASEQTDNSSTSGAQWARLKGDEIAARNRYMNVDPYANNRVKLQIPEGQCDYINASPIRLPTSAGQDKKFIATQVCLECPASESQY
jgi:protein-tyrosine phosphatase